MKNENREIKNVLSDVGKKMPIVFYLTLFIFVVCCITAIVLFVAYVCLYNLGLIDGLNIVLMSLILLIGSIVISTSIVRGFGNKILFGSLRQINAASKAVANGDFSQRLEVPKEKETAEICINFNEMVNKLGDNELLARDFVSNVSHQFRTPLSSIHGYAQLLESNDLSDEERMEYIGIIEEKSLGLSKLVNDILELARLEHQSSALSKELFSIDEQIRKCVISMEKNLFEKDLEIELNLEPIKFVGSKELLREVWNNLLENAIKFSNNGGKIQISAKQELNNIVVNFKDNGCGMSDETKTRLFERFYRGREVQGSSGSGLGMSMVKSILQKHNATICVESVLGSGSEFVITLPII